MFWITVFLTAAWAAPVPPPTRLLALGEQRILKVARLQKYSLSAPCIRIGGDGETLLIKGIREGVCELGLKASREWTQVRFQVFRPQHGSTDPALLEALSRLENTEVLPLGNRWILRGTVRRFEEAWKIRKLEEAWPERVVNEADLDPRLAQEAATRLLEWIRKENLIERLRLSSSDNQVVLAGDAPSEEARLDWIRRARRIFPLVRAAIRGLGEAGTPLHLQVYLVAVKRTENRGLGLQWEETGAGLLRLTAQGLANPLDLAAKIRALESEGVAQLLSRPEVVVRVPGEAELFAGGELPLQQRSRFMSQVQWKGYGLSLKIKALLATDREVRLEIQTEQSRLDEGVKLQELPAIQSNRLRTLVDARFGVPILLSGLIQEDQQWRSEGLPGLRAIPLLGLLFGSDSRSKDHSELVAVLLPNLGTPVAPLAALKRLFPRGPLPWGETTGPDAEALLLRQSPEYPWNALEP